MSLLTLPAPDSSLTVETRPKLLTPWLERLPYASPLDTAQQLLAALHALNRHSLGMEERYTLMALYRPAITRAVANLEPLMTEAGVPPLAQQRQAAILMRDLLEATSIGYQHLWLGLSGRSIGRGHAKRQTEIAARLMAALRDWMAACYLGYGTPPAGLWLAMHQLQQAATTAGVADTAPDDALPASVAYRQALLLALADPPRLSRSEFLHTQFYLDRLASLARVQSTRPAIGFAVPCDQDRGPGQADPDHAPDPALWLDTDALSRALHEMLLRMRTGDSPGRIGLNTSMDAGLSLALGKRLLTLWRTGVKRGFQRYPAASTPIDVVAGVSAIHRLLDYALPQPAQTDAPDEDNLIADVAPLLAPGAQFFTSRWTLCNDSATGLALSGIPVAPLNLKVGDPVALRPGIIDDATLDALAEPGQNGLDQGGLWSLAVIRWVRMHDAQRIELGIERLSPHMQPVWVRPLRGRRKGSPEPALFIPGLTGLKQPDRLLLPRYIYQSGMDAEIWHPPRQYLLTFGRRLEHTSSFDLIDFTAFAGEVSP